MDYPHMDNELEDIWEGQTLSLDIDSVYSKNTHW